MGGAVDVGAPWLLGSDLLERPEVSREFIRQSRPHLAELEPGFRKLHNLVHAENKLAIRWLKWLGFSLAAAPLKFHEEPFFYFWKEIA
ncbi:hypothetical protein FACS189460_6000 [Deltaproteobacteria bacterium]|nr:hypothetical protein FACS189460_6000 [Deltaproteobacteria bacterium]